MIRLALALAMLVNIVVSMPVSFAAASEDKESGWKLYTNARFGFSIRYPDDWRPGNPMPDGMGVTLYPPIDHSLVAFSGHMNVVSGSSQDGRQTLDEFASAHRRIITELYSKKSIAVKWRPDQNTSLAGFPAKHLTFTYEDGAQGTLTEHHIFTLGRNEGRGVRLKGPFAEETRLLSAVKNVLSTYQPGRDQNAVSPLAPTPGHIPAAPR